MQIYNSLNTNEGLSVALGFFDGIHLGHKTVIETAVKYAKKCNTKSAVITFQEHPCCFFYDVEPRYVIKRGDKIKLLEKLGVDYLYFIKFDENIAKMSGEEYLKDVIIKHFKPVAISTGFNHRFGNQKSADVELLKTKQEEFEYKYFEIPPVNCDGITISSTNIRDAISKGDIALANKMLGYNYSIEGSVIFGQQLGRTIGFSTANLSYPDTLVNIGYGVYEVDVDYKGRKFKGVANFGCRPSVTKNPNPVLEVNIQDFDEMIYYEKIKVTFLRKIRDEKKFDSLDELKAQIEKDIEQIS